MQALERDGVGFVQDDAALQAVVEMHAIAGTNQQARSNRLLEGGLEAIAVFGARRAQQLEPKRFTDHRGARQDLATRGAQAPQPT